jgi:hypothetical protein
MLCLICKRDVEENYIERHHLIPKCKKGKETINVCRDCGNQLHKIFTIKEMTKYYNTLEKILDNEKIQNWIKWIQKRPHITNVCMKTLKTKI